MTDEKPDTYIAPCLSEYDKKVQLLHRKVFPFAIISNYITCIAVMPTKDLTMSPDKSSPSTIISNRLTPYCFKMESDLIMEVRNTSISIIDLPIPDHCDPIPENINHTGLSSVLAFCKLQYGKEFYFCAFY